MNVEVKVDMDELFHKLINYLEDDIELNWELNAHQFEMLEGVILEFKEKFYGQKNASSHKEN